MVKKSKKAAKEEIDVLSHHLVPKMNVLSEAEKNRVLKKFEITEEQLPKFRHNDPAVVALKANLGDVIKIERDDGTGKYTAYRVVSKK